MTWQDRKDNAPQLPEHTCHIFNSVQATVNGAVKTIAGLLDDITDAVETELEEAREANELLRESSYYWYQQAKNIQRELEAAEDALSETQALLAEARAEIQSLHEQLKDHAA